MVAFQQAGTWGVVTFSLMKTKATGGAEWGGHTLAGPVAGQAGDAAGVEVGAQAALGNGMDAAGPACAPAALGISDLYPGIAPLLPSPCSIPGMPSAALQIPR